MIVFKFFSLKYFAIFSLTLRIFNADSLKEKVSSSSAYLEKVLGSSDPDSGKGKSKMSKNITHGFHLVKGKSGHAMEDYVVAQFKQVDDNELGLFAIFDGDSGHDVHDYLRSNLFDNILKEPDFWTETANAVRRAYHLTVSKI